MSTTPPSLTAYGNAASGRLLTRREAAEFLSISERKLFSVSAPRGALATVQIGGRILYSLADLTAFVAQNRVTQTTG